MSKQEINLTQEFSAQVWAKEFNKTLVKLGHPPHDEGFLISWFANAIMAGYDHANRMAPPAKPACDCEIQPCEIHDPTENLAIRLLEESGAVTLRDLVDTYRKVNEPSAGWPTVKDIESIMFRIDCENYRKNFGSRSNEVQIQKVYAEAIHVAFTKCLKERGIS